MSSIDEELIGPITSIPLALNGYEATVGWSSSGGWCMTIHTDLTSLTPCIFDCVSDHGYIQVGAVSL